MVDKSEIRRRTKEQFKKLAPALREHFSRQIAEQAMNLAVFQNSGTILLYSAIQDEVQTQDLVASALKLGKRVALPRIEDRDLGIYCIRPDGDCFKRGVFGISEPDPEVCERISLDSIDLALVPGRAFDFQCNRVGRGAGYYDRLLGMRGAGLSVFGLAFGFQLLEEVPHEAHDIPVDGVITESEVLRPATRMVEVDGAAEMEALGRELSASIPPPATFALTGDLGAGKTTLTRGLLEGWGADDSAVSPTYILVNEYDAICPVRHLDAYRLDSRELLPEDEEMLTEALDCPGYTLIEWAERVPRLIPPTRIAIHIDRTGDNTRSLRIETVRLRDHGASSRRAGT